MPRTQSFLRKIKECCGSPLVRLGIHHGTAVMISNHRKATNTKKYGNKVASIIERVKLSQYFSKHTPPKGSNKEVAAFLKATKPKIIWWLWLQGLENAPLITKLGLLSIKKLYPDHQLIILDSHNLLDYIDLPVVIEKLKNRGLISNAHFSDIVRLLLLTKYGGTWLDATVFCTSIEKHFLENGFFIYKTALEQDPTIFCSNWAISTPPANPVLIMTLRLLLDYWEKHPYITDYFIFHVCIAQAAKVYPEIWERVPLLPNTNPHLLQFEAFRPFEYDRWLEITRLASTHKLTYFRQMQAPESLHGTTLFHCFASVLSNQNKPDPNNIAVFIDEQIKTLCL